MDFSNINWLAVLACLVFSMISGSLWFGPKTFFPIWWKAIGKAETELPKGTPLTWVLLIGACAMQIIFLALMIASTSGGPTVLTGIALGLILWFGIIVPTSLVNKLFPGHLKAWLIEVGNHLINFVVFGAILGGWH
jgi:hypothetical protein